MQESKASRLFLISSVVLGLLAAVVSFAYLNQATAANNGPKITVIVAKHDLREGSTLDPDKDFDEMEIPPRMTALQMRGIDPKDKSAYKNQRINRRILAGTPIMLADLVPAADLEIKGDSRALSIPVKGAQGLSGLLIPGDRVKLLVTVPMVRNRSLSDTQPSFAQSQWQTQQVLPDPVKVLAVGSRLARSRLQISMADQYTVSNESESQQTVTLEVTEEQATTILAQTGAGSLPVTLILCPPTTK